MSRAGADSGADTEKPADAKRKQRPRVTSAIEGMTMTEVRRDLNLLRKKWSNRNKNEPFLMSLPLENNLTIEEFAYKFVMGHHLKRHTGKG